MNKEFTKYIVIIAFALFGVLNIANAFSDKKVILLATHTGQSDSLGYNFVSDLSAAAYSWISDGKVVLWDSPEKKTSLNISDLKAIEKKSQAFFSKTENVFIYENWSSRPRKFSAVFKGFSFTGVNNKGDAVLFGYIESNIALKDLLKNELVHATANGNYHMNLYAVLMNMAFQFNLVYFDHTALQDFNNSSRIVQKAINPKKKNTTAILVADTRLVEYGWDSTDLDQSKVSDSITSVISEFFDKNQQEYFNYGGDKYYSYLKNRKLLITGLHVIQEWTKDKKGNISFKLMAIVPYTVGYPLQAIPALKLTEWGIKYKNALLTDVLNTRDFPYSIKKINETFIPPVMADWVKANILLGDWKHLLSKNIHIN